MGIGYSAVPQAILTSTIRTLEGQASVVRGDRYRLRRHIMGGIGLPLDVSADSFTFTVRDGYSGAVLITKTSPVGIDMTLASSGIVDVLIDEADTVALKGNYVYDLQTVRTGKTLTLVAALFVVLLDVTAP